MKILKLYNMNYNKLIAEFMGMTYGDPNDDSVMIQMTSQGNEVVPIESMKYHTSWDWLMPVVIKCFEVDEQTNDDLNFKLNYALLETNIDCLYKVVVEFIISNDYKTCDKCCYDIVDDNGDVMEHHCVDNQKDLALITSIIINEDVLGGTIFQTFDKAYALAEKFQDKFSHDFNWENQKLDFDEAIILFTKQELEKTI